MFSRAFRNGFLVLALLFAIMAFGGAVGAYADSPITTQSYVANNGDSTRPTTNAEGNLIAYQTKATGLLSNGQPLNGNWQIVVYDRDTDHNGVYDEPGSTETRIVSALTNGTQANADAVNPAMSNGGDAVGFESAATNLTSQGGNSGKTEIFISHIYGVDFVSKAYGDYAPNSAHHASVSGFWTTAYYFDAGSGHPEEVWLHDFWGNVDAMVSRRQNGTAATGNSRDPSISEDGCSVAYMSYDNSLDPAHTESGDNDGDIFIYDRDPYRTGTCSDVVGNYKVIRISLKNGSTNTTSGNSYSPAMSLDGREVAFVSDVQLTSDDTNALPDVYLYQRDTDGNGIFDEPGGTSLTLVSPYSYGYSYNPAVYYPYVVFDTTDNFVSYDTNGSISDAVGYNFSGGYRELFSRYKNAQNQSFSGNDASSHPVISSASVVFQSLATDLVQDDSADGYSDIYAISRTDGTMVKVSTGPGGNIPDNIDIGFRPKPHGYQFKNQAVGNYVTRDDFKKLFGVSDYGNYCNGTLLCLSGPSEGFYREIVQAADSGSCFGFAATSQRFYAELDQPDSLGASTTYGLDINNNSYKAKILRNLAFYYMQQYRKSVRDYIEAQYGQSMTTFRNNLAALLQSSNKGNYPIITFFGNDYRKSFFRDFGHAVTPYKMESLGSGLWKIWVYDNNKPDTSAFPDANNYFITINTNDNSWQYDMGNPVVVASSYEINKIALLPVSRLQQNNAVSSASVGLDELPIGTNSTERQIVLPSEGFVTNSSGQNTGYVNGNIVNEIPGAYIYVPFAVSLDNPAPDPSVFVPAGDTYQVTSNSVRTSFFGPNSAGYTSSGTNAGEYVNINQDGSFSFSPYGSGASVDMGVAVNGNGQSLNFDLSGADFATYQTASLSAANGSASYVAGFGTGGSYDVTIRRTNSAGEQIFHHTGISVQSGDTQTYEYSNWDGSGKITVKIDHNSDGSVDQTLQLENQYVGSTKVYLPIVIK